MCVLQRFHHACVWLRTRKHEWVSTYFALLKNSGEVNCPTSVASTISDAATVVARSLKSVSMLSSLAGKLIFVCSLLTSMRLLGSRALFGQAAKEETSLRSGRD